MPTENFQVGDVVAVNTPAGKREGIVLGSHVDWNVREATPLGSRRRD